MGLLLSCLGSPWGVAASGAPGSPGEKLPQGELGIPQATHPRHTKGVRFLAHPRYPLGIPTSVPEVSPGAPRFFAVVRQPTIIGLNFETNMKPKLEAVQQLSCERIAARWGLGL